MWCPSEVDDIQALERPAKLPKKDLWDEGADLLGGAGDTENNVPLEATPEVRAYKCLEDLSWTSI